MTLSSSPTSINFGNMASKQTRLGFQQQKPGSRRTLNSKYSKVMPRDVTEDGTEIQEAEPTLLEAAGTHIQTMEEKLAEYRLRKAKEAQKVSPTLEHKVALRSRTSAVKSDPKSTLSVQRTTRTLTRTLVKKTQTFESDPPVKATSVQQEVETPEADKIYSPRSSAGDSAIDVTPIPAEESLPADKVNLDKHVVKESAPKTSSNSTSDNPAQRSDQLAGKDSESKEKVEEKPEEDDIHPLARTVVKAKPLAAPRVTISETRTPAHTEKPSHIPPKTTLRKTILETSADHTPPLPMPAHFCTLHAIFLAFEYVLEFTKRQNKSCFYHQLKKHVELQSSRNFDIERLAQIKTILPEGYKLTEAQCMIDGFRTRSILIEKNTLDNSTGIQHLPQQDIRKRLFLERLCERIQKQHQIFLSLSEPPRTDTYPYSWHPEFDLSTVPAIEEADIPLLKPQVVDASRLDIRNLVTRKLVDPAKTPRTDEKAKAAVDSKKEPESPKTDIAPIAEMPTQEPLTALEKLKERIRQKQMEKKGLTSNMPTPEQKKDALVASRLPAAYDLIRFKRIDVIAVKSLAEQMIKSSRMPVSEVEVKATLEMLAKELPEWCTLFPLQDGMYFKVLKPAVGSHDEKSLRARLVARARP